MKEIASGRMDARRHSFSFKIEQADNGSFVASVVHEGRKHADDDVGALYYVIAVIFIYGCSILMMIASYIRKNKTDRKLNRYLKEMANVRKRERQMQLLSATAKAATISKTGNKPAKLEGFGDGKEGNNAGKISGKVPSKLTFQLDTAGPQKLYSDKVYLDLPVSSYAYNSDSDNETSTEAEPIFQSTLITSHSRSPSQKSILKKTCRSKSVTLMIPSDSDWSKRSSDKVPRESPTCSPQKCASPVGSSCINIPDEVSPSLEKEHLTSAASEEIISNVAKGNEVTRDSNTRGSTSSFLDELQKVSTV